MGRELVSLDKMKATCGKGYRPVSIQSAEHVIWLSDQVESLKGRGPLKTNAGIPLGYDYNQNNNFYDLNDDTRSVNTQIFKKNSRSRGGEKGSSKIGDSW